MKKAKVQDTFLAELRRVPIVSVAAEKTNVSRNSIYQWRKRDPEFLKQMDEAMAVGDALVCDMSESQLLSLISEKHWPAIQFYLTRRSPKFRDRLEIKTVTEFDDNLTPEQELQVKRALEYGFGRKKEEDDT
jgi:hypothetical protein